MDVTLNDRLVRRLPVDRSIAITLRLEPPYFAVAPNMVGLAYRYQRGSTRADPRYRIGLTSAASPGDLEVRSVGGPDDSAASIRLNGRELSPNGRGYNLVALASDGEVLAAASFDTFFAADAAQRLVRWVTELSPGTIVAGAVRDEGSTRLSPEAVGALGTLGVRGDLRGRYRAAHAFVGVKGALRGAAVEALDSRPVTLVVGQRPRAEIGVEVVDFELRRI